MDRREYFDGLSSRWDSFTDAAKVQGALATMLQGFDLRSDEHILDLGCGTGNLTQVLCSVLGARGRITAVDLAPAMIATARERVTDPRVQWVVADAMSLPLPDASVDRVICFSAWAHFPDPWRVAKELGRVIRTDGQLHIVHIDGRDKINAIHTGAGGAIGHDLLPPAADLVSLLRAVGYAVAGEVDTPDSYRVSARWVQ
ncbi:MAG: class I SAM-dependent methyltransferase [Ignavibacteriae bacterium]|nr:class I SAM-dependent methyltransferase [Ignavibacteriota bacterium]